VYVVAPDGRVAFVNPAGVAILGFDDAAQLLGRDSHSTIHAHRRDGSPYPEHECPCCRARPARRCRSTVLIETARSLHLTTLQRIRKITLPALMPGSFAGVRIGGPIALVVTLLVVFSLLVGALIAALEGCVFRHRPPG